LAIERILAKLRQIVLPPVGFALLMRGRFVVELSVMTGDAELFHQTESGEYLQVIEEKFGEDLLVKQIQAPWPEPDEIDQEYGDHERNDCNYRAEPLQNAF
jgi:hypothetical protein